MNLQVYIFILDIFYYYVRLYLYGSGIKYMSY
jgi:hypothetical protein